MKRLLAFLLIMTVLCTLAACRSGNGDGGVSSAPSHPSSAASSGTESSAASGTEAGKSAGNKTGSEKKTAAAEKKSARVTASVVIQEDEPSSERTAPASPAVADVSVKETVVIDDVIEEPTARVIDTVGLNTEHSPYPETGYYQRSNLTGNAKAAYLAIADTVAASKSIVDVSRLGMSEEEVMGAFQRVLTDYPQFFYLSRSCILVFRSFGREVRALVLLYTDGTVTDEFDGRIRMTRAADRDLINRKISALNAGIRDAVSTVSADYPDVLKEKILYDRVIETVEYDRDAAANADSYDVTVPHAFDLYGAAVEGRAVCEGYAKLFQYLCYCVGINVTQVIGTAGGYDHMWNAVQIGGEWYQADATWDDTGKLTSYGYFNITDSRISVDHQTDSSTLSVPVCTAVTNSFTNAFAVRAADLSKPPVNYENASNAAKLSGDKNLYLYIEGYKKDRTGAVNARLYLSYLEKWFYSKNSAVWAYLNEQGITLSASVNKSGEYIVIPIRRQ